MFHIFLNVFHILLHTSLDLFVYLIHLGHLFIYVSLVLLRELIIFNCQKVRMVMHYLIFTKPFKLICWDVISELHLNINIVIELANFLIYLLSDLFVFDFELSCWVRDINLNILTITTAVEGLLHIK